MIKKIIPKWAKVAIKLALKQRSDVLNGYAFRWARPGRERPLYSKEIVLRQQLFPNEAKLRNLQIAIDAINSVDIYPNEIFSFWKVVGAPSVSRGFVKSRSLVAGKIEASIGGGLCQLSGMIYYLSLMAGLKVVERHNHSIDIYTDATRYTPLGSDATVAYGYKDLRIENTFQEPISFSFHLDRNSITIWLHFNDTIKKQQVDFKQHQVSSTTIEVETIVNGKVDNAVMYQRS